MHYPKAIYRFREVSKVIRAFMAGKMGKSESTKAVFEHILKEIKPGKDELSAAVACTNEITSRLKKEIPKSVEIIVAGSIARGTQLSGASDLDIFLLFPQNMDERKMEEKALTLTKRIVNKRKNERFIIKYAEHPYLQLILKDLNMKVDIVPAFKINHSRDRGTAVDRTQLHNDFVISNLRESQKDQVRLLKFFLKQRGIYGAEAKIEGFSGYLCELLIHQYGDFLGVLQNFSKLTVPVAIDPKSRALYHGRNGAEQFVQKFSSKFVVIDPVDRERNVAANVSMESLSMLVVESRRFLKNISLDAFYGKRYSTEFSSKKLLSLARKTGTDLLTIEFEMGNISEDILWQQLRKLRLRLCTLLKDNMFEPLISFNSISDRCGVICFFVRNVKIESKISKGPSVFMAKPFDSFVNAHSKNIFTFIEDERILSLEKAKSKTSVKFLSGLIKSKSFDLPSHLNRNNVKIYINKIPESCGKQIYMEMQRNWLNL